MKRRPKVTTLVYDDARLIELLRGGARPDSIPDDALTRSIAKLACKYGSDRVAQRAQLIDDYVWVSEPKPRKASGAKLKWGDTGNYHAWLVVEHTLHDARKANSAVTLADVLRDKFRKLRGKRWCIHCDRTGAGKHLYLNDAKQARNRYIAGRRLLLANPMLAARARRLFPHLQFAQKLRVKQG